MRLIDSHCHVNAERFADDADLVIGAARLAGVERILVPGWNVASCERALDLAERLPGSTPRSASILTTPPRSTTPAGRGSSAGRRRAGRRDRRDRPRLRPASSARSRTSSPTCAGTSRWPPRPASRRSSTADRPRVDAMRRTRCSPRSGRSGAPRTARRSSTRFSGPSTTPRRCSSSARRSAFRASSSGRRGGAAAEVAAIVPLDRLLVETDSPFLSPPGAPRGRNEPEWVRVTAAWLAERRGDRRSRRLGDALVAAYDRTFHRRAQVDTPEPSVVLQLALSHREC